MRTFYLAVPGAARGLLAAAALFAALPGPLPAGMQMSPYFSAVNYPMEKQALAFMALPDFQLARYGKNYMTGMLMAQYGLTSGWTAGLMAEGQKIQGQPFTYGGLRANTYFHLFQDDRLLNLTLYGEYEDLNGAALYKMEVTGFGAEDLVVPLPRARRTHVRSLETRIIVYHDWGQLNATFNFIRETYLQAPRGSEYGYALGLSLKPSWPGGVMAGMSNMTAMAAPHSLSMSRLGIGLEMLGALGDNERFGVYLNSQQHYAGPVFTYALSPAWSMRFQPSFGLTDVSDPFMLRTGLSYMLGPRGGGRE